MFHVEHLVGVPISKLARGLYMSKSPLGRGLASLLGERQPDEVIDPALVKKIPVDKIVSNPFQPRENFSTQQIQELADSIAVSGLLQPIVVRRLRDRDKFELIAGERRWRAVKSLGWKTIPALVKEISDKEMALLALVENVQREDLSPIEEAKTYKLLMERFSLTQEALSKLIGKSRSHIANILRLLKLPKDVQKEINEGRLSFSQARELLSGGFQQDLHNRMKKVIEAKMTVRQIRKEKDPFSKRIEELFQEFLGTKVRLEHSDRKKSGRLIIEYYSLQDLDRLLEIVKQGRRSLNAGSISVN